MTDQPKPRPPHAGCPTCGHTTNHDGHAVALAILADLGSPVAACEDSEWDALLVAVETAREDFPDHFEQWEREVSA